MKVASQAGFIRKIDRDAFPMRLWQKAKRLGVWNPEEIDFSRDRQDWLSFTPEKREYILQLCAFFQAGEQAVTRELLPLIRVIGSQGRLEEEIYLSSFFFEEAKHVDLFSRFLSEVCEENGDLSCYLNPTYESFIGDEFPRALRRLNEDQSPEAQARAAGTYNIVVEGVLAETGYYLFDRMLFEKKIFPGLAQAIGFLRRDESRHIAFGIYLLSRLIDENGDGVRQAFIDRMSELAPIIEKATRDFMDFFGREHAFGVSTEELSRYAFLRFSTRMRRILSAQERKNAQTVAQ